MSAPPTPEPGPPRAPTTAAPTTAVALQPGPRRMAAWKIVALTLGGVFLAGVIFFAGFLAGVVTSDVAGKGLTADSNPGGGNSNNGSGEGSNDGDAAPPASGAFDECLVGTWKTTSYEQRAKDDKGSESVLTGLDRTFKGSVTTKAGDKVEKKDLQPGTGDVTYSCSGDTYTEPDDQGFKGTATRVK